MKTNNHCIDVHHQLIDDYLSIEKQAPWEEIARPNQLLPPGNWNIWMILAGRGFGKTRSAAEAIRKWACGNQYRRIALISNTIQEARQVMVEGESGILSISDVEEKLQFFPSRRLLQWPNGAIATLYGAEEYEQLRGPQFDAAWVDEFAKFQYPKDTFDQLSMALRLGKNPKMILTTTPRPLQFIKDLLLRDDVVVVRGTSHENIQNLSPNFLKQLEYLRGTRLEAQEIYAELLEENPNTLWSWSDIESCHKSPPHFLQNIVIGIDPALTSHKDSDKTGIIVAGMDGSNHAYVLDDLSISANPTVWAQRAVDAYHKYRAKKIVIETNAGGDLLLHLLRSIDGDVRIKPVHASSSKVIRAEPIVVLYQKGLIYHCRQFHELEMQMVTYEPKNKSPDRLDALVWAMTELFDISSITQIPSSWTV
ncbi:MAG: terminase family protein [Holosporaceae bacterium]|jgi:phage terminase large subunit-like protein|nr:terminase family protein [Holosporaceae bacterium]